jgi:peroxiredoxin/outer membrane lipoprotein-sorting protein
LFFIYFINFKKGKLFMKKIVNFILLAFFAVGIFSCSQNKDPKQLFIEADKAAQSNNSAEFKITVLNKGAQGDATFTSSIFVKKDANSQSAFPIKYRIEEPNTTLITYDGKQFIVTDLKNKKISVSQREGVTEQFAERLGQNFYMIVDHKLDTAEINANSKNLELKGKTTVSGQECYQVLQKGEGHGEYQVENNYFFSVDKKLMLKYTSVITNKDKKVVQSIEYTISDLKINPNLDDKLFTQTIDTNNYTYEDLDAAHDKMNQNPHENMDNPHGDNPNSEEPTGLLPNGTPAPDWNLLDKDGNKVALSQLKGKVVVIDFWATWCGPCKQAMPTIQKLYNTYKNKGVVVLGINVSENADPVKFMKENGYSYRLLLNGDQVATNYKVEGIPTMYVIDKNGKIAFGQSGVGQNYAEKLEAAIKKSL